MAHPLFKPSDLGAAMVDSPWVDPRDAKRILSNVHELIFEFDAACGRFGLENGFSQARFDIRKAVPSHAKESLDFEVILETGPIVAFSIRSARMADLPALLWTGAINAMAHILLEKGKGDACEHAQALLPHGAKGAFHRATLDRLSEGFERARRLERLSLEFGDAAELARSGLMVPNPVNASGILCASLEHWLEGDGNWKIAFAGFERRKQRHEWRNSTRSRIDPIPLGPETLSDAELWKSFCSAAAPMIALSATPDDFNACLPAAERAALAQSIQTPDPTRKPSL